MALMTIGQLARRVGLRPFAIRYYEAHGILCPPVRSARDYRLYGADAVALLRFVQHAKELSFSLAETRQIIEAARNQPPCVLTRTLIERHLAQVESELDRLRSLQARLKRLLRQAPPATADGVCPLIEGDRCGNSREGVIGAAVTALYAFESAVASPRHQTFTEVPHSTRHPRDP